MSEASTITEADLLSRVIDPDDGAFSPEAARSFLGLTFPQEDVERLHALAEKNRHDTITDAERSEMEKYMRVGNFLSLLKSKARRSLQESTHE